jgi:hypothetical protein
LREMRGHLFVLESVRGKAERTENLIARIQKALTKAVENVRLSNIGKVSAEAELRTVIFAFLAAPPVEPERYTQWERPVETAWGTTPGAYNAGLCRWRCPLCNCNNVGRLEDCSHCGQVRGLLSRETGLVGTEAGGKVTLVVPGWPPLTVNTNRAAAGPVAEAAAETSAARATQGGNGYAAWGWSGENVPNTGNIGRSIERVQEAHNQALKDELALNTRLSELRDAERQLQAVAIEVRSAEAELRCCLQRYMSAPLPAEFLDCARLLFSKRQKGTVPPEGR